MNSPKAAWLLSDSYRWRLLFVLLLAMTLSFADRTVFAVVSQLVKQELRLSDFQLGALQGVGFAIVYAVGALPIARLAEGSSRVMIISIAVATWSVMTALSGVATNFVTMLLARAGVGIGEAGGSAPATSLISDHFPATRRAFAMAIFLLGSPFGALAGSLVGGWVALHYGWRAAFFALAAPGLIVALLVFVALKEPPRGLADGTDFSATPPPSLWVTFKYLIAKPTFILVTVAGSLAALGMSGISQWMVPFLSRTYHLDVQETARFYGVITFVALSAGILLGGFAGDRLGRHDLRWQSWGAAIGVFAAVPLYAGAFLETHLYGAVAFLLFGGFSLFLYFAPTVACIQNMATPRMRVSAAALFGLIFSTTGPGLGPTIMGFFSDYFAQHAFALGDFSALCRGDVLKGASQELSQACAAASGVGLRQAFLTVLTTVFGLSGIIYLIAARTIRQDVYQPHSGGP